jgi:hypothetical protein
MKNNVASNVSAAPKGADEVDVEEGARAPPATFKIDPATHPQRFVDLEFV